VSTDRSYLNKTGGKLGSRFDAAGAGMGGAFLQGGGLGSLGEDLFMKA
jgi:hypothetical protein